jgi:DNA-binding transcriptional LysR family regulator
MDITRDQRIAFLTVCRLGSITRAAQELHLTQAALSIRLKKLEDILSISLFVRSRTGVQTTEAGKRFFEYVSTFETWEKNWWREYTREDNGLTGEIRIGSFSTIGRSLVLPAVQTVLCENPELRFHSYIKEYRELPTLLTSGEADFVFLDRPILKDRIESLLLGYEEYVHIKGKNQRCNLTTYLNHDESDDMSFRWFHAVGRKSMIEKRRFMDEIYSVIDGVAMGVGVSILPQHLIEKDKRIKIVNRNEKLLSPVYLNFHTRSFYSRAFLEVKEALLSIGKSLKQKA